MEKKINSFNPFWPHGHVTRNGKNARIICKNRAGKQPLVVLVSSETDSTEHIFCCNEDGTINFDKSNSGWDLFNAPKPKKGIDLWLNVYRERHFGYATRQIADNNASADRIACIHVTGKEGEGL